MCCFVLSSHVVYSWEGCVLQFSSFLDIMMLIFGKIDNPLNNWFLNALHQYGVTKWKWAAPGGNVSSEICGLRRARSACASAQSAKGNHCPLTIALDTTNCMNGK